MITVNVDFKDFIAITKPESISRCRRQLINESKSEPKLKWLLDDIETLSKRENLENLNHDYFQDLYNSKIAEVVK
jgi:hypothetical protein